jgi:hypothetical protein
LNAHLSEISIPDNYLPQQVDNILGAALASLAKSFSYTAEGANPGDNNLTAFLMANITWNDWIKSMTENRLRSAVQFTANLWYTAMIQAGFTIRAPTLTSPSNGSSTTDNTPTFTWTSVSGTSSYDFQLASDNNFTINARTVKGLATNSYTPVTPLMNGGWYWHVRTGDNSADVGLWSQTQSFTVSVSTQNPVVVISPISQSGANGATLTYTVTVSNTENATDNFNLTASDNASPSWGPTVSPTSLTIPAGENRTATLSVTVPSNAVGGTIDNMSVTANGNGGSGSARCTAQVTIARSVSASISPTSQNGPNGATLNYTVTVYNTGNVSDNYSLTTTDNSGWSRSVSPTYLVVAAFSSDNTTLSVTVPSNAIGGAIDNVTVTATDNGVSASGNCTAQATITKGVNTTILPSSQSGSNGAVLTYAVTVANTGNVSDTYNLTATNTAGWSENVSPTSLSVPPFSSGTATLSVTIPENAIGNTIDNITVTTTDNVVSASGNCTAQVTISRSVSISISPSSQSGPNGSTLTYTVAINNTGNVSDNYSLTSTENASPSWSPSVLPTSLGVPAFGSDNATLSVTIPPSAIVGTIDNITVTANGTGDNSSNSCVAHVVMLSCTGTASIRLATTGTVPFLWGVRESKLNINLMVYQGDNLRLIFLANDNVIVESENAIWSRTAPGAQTVNLTNLIVPHDSTTPYPSVNVQRVKLVLTDNMGNMVWDNMAWYKVVQDDWGSRITWITLNWSSHNSSQQDQLGMEITQIILNWSNVSTISDQSDFSQL